MRTETTTRYVNERFVFTHPLVPHFIRKHTIGHAYILEALLGLPFAYPGWTMDASYALLL